MILRVNACSYVYTDLFLLIYQTKTYLNLEIEIKSRLYVAEKSYF